MGASGGRWGTARLLARCALLALAAALGVLLLALVEAGPLIFLSGLGGIVVSAVGLWWLGARRGPLRLLGALLAVGAPLGALLHWIREDVWGHELLALALYGVALICARAALRATGEAYVMRGRTGPAPRRPVLIMNPESGGGKVGRFGLVGQAEQMGAQVHLLDTQGGGPDVEALARGAVAEGADLLGVAGGDGTQALVAAVAVEHDLPFLVISAGTRNHFAMDLGLDRTDPARCLDALTDGEELRVDLGSVNGRPFVNTVSFGVYADIVQRPEYRDAKSETAFGLLPDLLGEKDRRLQVTAGERQLAGQQAVLVSNNAYATPDLTAASLRTRLDGGKLGIIGVRVEDAVQVADVALREERSPALNFLTARRAEISAEAENIPVAVDGEALTLPTPVLCTVRRRALRVLVPRTRPGTKAPSSPLNWRWMTALAMGRTR
ncbi:diacylglycerol/lipid kinase family protein [Streptomyces iconiensis]|uniref:Diacylglycerol kinase family protein n=1 Tax=Streptomyces iconiensis TaxID=1384038 RepID=A0ABT6ZYU9_9ACTN|nr:diacylglycerol kinase family protein [Streptomyces iconiensis]MDJ1134243.1 diacylglycerol kinase family protein [Streptomyces iconiensis]